MKRTKGLKIGYFEHWHQPQFKFVNFLCELGLDISKIDYSQPGYLEEFDIALIEQNGFNDYIENDETYIHEWVKNGGILLFMHQDYQRWAPYFLPTEVGYTQLIHRYIPTIGSPASSVENSFTDDLTPYMTYMMPWIEKPGERLFSEPEIITPDEMLDWKLYTGSFNIVGKSGNVPRQVRTTAESCFLVPEQWEILGSFMDSAVRDGALILKANYGKGMFFINQLLFPETDSDENTRCIAFWVKYIKNLMAYFERFKNGEKEIKTIEKAKTLPIKKNYKMSIHMHSLDWYGADSAPGTINAIMRYMGWDICALAVKDNAPYQGKLDVEKYSDDKVLFLNGQEYHPFNWNDKYEHLSHNTYHLLAIGIDEDAYTNRYTKSLYSDKEIDEYLKDSINYVHKHGGAICATHPNVDFWSEYDVDAVDKEPMVPLSGSDIEKQWLSGRRFGIMNSVDLFGVRRVFDNPAVNFIYLKGETPCRDNIVKAVKGGHTIAATGFDEADITLNGYVPGDELPLAEALEGEISISAKIKEGCIHKIRVYSDDELIVSMENNKQTVDIKLKLKEFKLGKFLRVELEGKNKNWICNSTPFYLV